MATIQELVNRNRNRGGGVTVYSPTRQITRPIANAGTARRILQTGGRGTTAWAPTQGPVQAQQRPQQMQLPSYTPPEQPGQGRTGLDDILDSIQARAPVQPIEEQPGGWRGTLGTVVNSWPAKAIMAPLNVLDIPRRTIVSTVNEVADMFNGGNASWDDFFDQVRDPNFGFGSVVGSTGNKWADRFIGLAGDVLLDPMTYVAGAGVFSGTGRAARQRLAGIASAAGMSEDVIEKIGRYGISSIDNSTREQLRRVTTLTGEQIGEPILDRGWYFKVPFQRGEGAFKRIPGTERLDQAIAPIFAHGRARFTETGLSGRITTTLRNRLRTPEVMREVADKLITGRGSMSFDEAAGIYFYVNSQRALGNTATARFTAEATSMIGRTNRRQLNEMIDTAETQGGTVLNKLFDRAAKFLKDAGIAFYPRKNYVPHILTQGAVEWFRSDSKLANAFRQALIPGLDLDELSPRLMERHLLAGTTAEIGLEGQKRTFNAGAGTIRDINAEFKRVFPELDFQLFDDDVESIIKVYSQHLGDDIGRAEGLKALVASKSRLVRMRSDEDMVKTLLDEEKLALLNKETADMLGADLRSISDRLTKLKEAQRSDTGTLQSVVGVYAREALDEVQNLESGLKDELDDLLAQEAALSHELGRGSALTGTPPPSTTGMLEAKLELATGQLEAKKLASDKRLADLQDAAAAEMIAWQSLLKMAGLDVGMMTVPEQFTSLRAWNMATAEAAELAMDAQALNTIRSEVAEAVRKAELLEMMAADPAYAGRVAGVALPEEQWYASQARFRTNEKGERIAIEGPAPGKRKGTRTEVPGEPVTSKTGRVIPWDPQRNVHEVVANATRRRQQLIEGSEAITEPGPRLGELARWRSQTYSEYKKAQRRGVTGQELADLKTTANRAKRAYDAAKAAPPPPIKRQRIPSAEEAQRAEIEAAESQQERIAAQMLEPEEELALRTERDEIGVQLALFERSETGRQVGEDQARLAEIEVERSNLERLVKIESRERQLVRDIERRPQRSAAIRDTEAEIEATRAEITRLRETIARGEARNRPARRAPLQLKAAQKKLRDAQARLRAAKAEIAGESPGRLEAIARREAAQNRLPELQREAEELQRRIDANMAGRADLDERAAQIDQELLRNTELNQELAAVQVPAERNIDQLRALERRIEDKQAELGLAEKNLDDMIEMHQPRVAERQAALEVEVLYEQDLRRYENDTWAKPADKQAHDAAARAIKAHREGPLHQAQQAYEHAQQPIKRAAERRDAIKQELADLKRQIVEGEQTPASLRPRFARINADEAADLQRARAIGDPKRTEYMTFPQMQIDAPSRRNVYTDEQRDRLAYLYSVVRNTHAVDKAGGKSTALVAQATKTVKDINARGGPKGPAEVDALREAHHVLSTFKDWKGTGANRRYREARREILEIERSVKGGVTQAQHEFGEVLRIANMLDEIEQARTPLKLPGRGSAKYKAVALSPRGPGGDPSVAGRAKANHDIADDWVRNYSQDLIDAGAIEDHHVEFIRRAQDDLKNLLEAYQNRATPDMQSEIEQASADLGRMVDVMLSYRNAIAAGYEPGPQVAAAIVLHRFLRERSTLDEQIEGLEDLLKQTPQARREEFDKAIGKKERKIADEQAIIDNPETSPEDVRLAINRRDAAKRTLRKMRAAGVPDEEGRALLQGVVEDEIDTMFKLLKDAVTEYRDADSQLKAVRDWREVYLTPLEKKIQYEDNAKRLPYELEQLRAARRRLRDGIRRARASGRDSFEYAPWTWTDRVSGLNIETAERRIASGEIPKYMAPTVRSRIARKRRAIESAQEQGRKVPEPVIDYSLSGKARRRERIMLADAEEALAKHDRAIASKEHELWQNQLAYEATSNRSMDDFLNNRPGSAAQGSYNQRRITELQTLLGDLDTPVRVEALNGQIRHIHNVARDRPGARLVDKLTDQEKYEIDLLKARIEQATSPLDETRTTAMSQELAARIESQNTYEAAMTYDTEFMRNVEDNGHRMLRDLVDGLRAPTKAEARLIRQMMGPEEGSLYTSVFNALDDYIADKSMLTDDVMRQAWDAIKEIAGGRRAGDDRLDRFLPTNEAGRPLSWDEMLESAKASSDVAQVLRAGGRELPDTGAEVQVFADGFREDFFAVLVASREAHLRQSAVELRHLLQALDIQIEPDMGLGAFVRKRLGGNVKQYTKKQRQALRKAEQPILTVSQRSDAQLRQFLEDTLKANGYDPALSVQRRLTEFKARRSRLNMYLRGMGMIIEDEGVADFEGLFRWWDTTAMADLRSADINSIGDLLATLRAPDSIDALANTRRRSLASAIATAERKGDTEGAATLRAELEQLTQGRYLPQPETAEVAPAPEAAIPEQAIEPVPEQVVELEPPRREAEPSERAVNQLDEPNAEELAGWQNELEQTKARQREVGDEVEILQSQLDALDAAALETTRTQAPTGEGASRIVAGMRQLAEERKPHVPTGMASHAEVLAAIEEYGAFANSIVDPDNLTPAQEETLERLINQVNDANARAWKAESKAYRRQAERRLEELQRSEIPTKAGSEEQLIESSTRAIELRNEISRLNDQADALKDHASALQRRINDSRKAHIADAPEADDLETPSVIEDPIGAELAEGRPPDGMGTEEAPSHLIDDHIFDRDASPEELAREYETVVTQSRALLEQYGSYRSMPPDVKRTAGELANRARAIGNLRSEAFQHATAELPPGQQKRLITAMQSMTHAANPRVDDDWWSVISTGTPPAGVATRVTGMARGNIGRGRLRRLVLERGELRGRGGSRHRMSLADKERILRGETEPTSILRTPVRKSVRGREHTIMARRRRPMTELERRAHQYPAVSAAQRDLQSMAERARAAATEGQARLAAAEGAWRGTVESLRTTVAEPAIARRQAALDEQHARMVHANDELAQEQRRNARMINHRPRINDAYTRALESKELQLGAIRRRAIEAQIDHESAARYLKLLAAVMTPEPKNSNVKQIWSDIRDLLEYKKSAEPPGPIALYPPGTDLAGMTMDLSSQPEIRQIEALLAAAWDQQQAIDDLALHHDLISKRLKDYERASKKHAFYTAEMAQDAIARGDTASFPKVTTKVKGEADQLTEVFTHQIADGWQAIAEDMFTGADALVINNNLKRAMDNIRRTIREPGFWKVIEKYTAFFSTYATARPGFHVRNAMSGTFMNMVDGVRLREMRRAPRVWHDFMRNPEEFWARVGPEADKQRRALMAVFATGAVGAFGERGLTEAVTTGSKIYRKLMNNFITRFNRKAGAYVEGPMRLAMALDSIEKGLSLNATIDRITKFHFDYTQLSEMDVVARRLIPFWTFMSRNLPLQIESMWLRPRTYLQYQSVVRNFGEEMNPFTPDYWASQGAFTMDENAGEGEPWYLAPDLPHLRVAEPLTAIAQGDLGRGVLSDINPLFLAPVEAYAAGKKFYTGQRISEIPRQPHGAGEQITAAIAGLFGQGETGRTSGQQLIDPRLAHIANATLPPIELLNRLFPANVPGGSTREGREGETWARFFGAPLYHLTKGVQQNTRRSQRYERREERDRQAQLARL